MIRINFVPGRKRGKAGLARGPEVPSQLPVLLMVVGWGLFCGLLYWLVTIEQEETERLRQEASVANAEVERLKKEMDFEKLQALKDKVEQQRRAIEKLKAQQKSPAFVMLELANLLTTGKLPDIDEEEQRKLEAADPGNKLTPNWDATGVWLVTLQETSGSIALTGGARDASDLSEFTRRLRASARFGEQNTPNFTKECDKDTCWIEWKLTTAVKRWD